MKKIAIVNKHGVVVTLLETNDKTLETKESPGMTWVELRDKREAKEVFENPKLFNYDFKKKQMKRSRS